jgi:putative acetyltransferase
MRERPRDRERIRVVNEDAFRRPDEADLIDRWRAEGVILLSLAAELNNQIVGPILFSRMTVETDHGSVAAVSCRPIRNHRFVS